jgi:hypothetical protein
VEEENKDRSGDWDVDGRKILKETDYEDLN